MCVCRKRQFVASSSLGTAAKPVQSHSFLRGYYFFLFSLKCWPTVETDNKKQTLKETHTQFLFLFFFSFLVSPACSVAPLFFFPSWRRQKKREKRQGGGGKRVLLQSNGPTRHKKTARRGKEEWVSPPLLQRQRVIHFQ